MFLVDFKPGLTAYNNKIHNFYNNCKAAFSTEHNRVGSDSPHRRLANLK